MIVRTDFEQGSPAWFGARAGIPSASRFSEIFTTKGEPSKQARKYMMQLAGEYVAGDKAETFQGWQMARGRDLEEEARGLYEIVQGCDVQTVGLVFEDERERLCCSPDGLVGEGGLEIKCPTMHVAVEYLFSDKLPTEYIQQVQGSMLVTGAPWWDFMSYYPGLPPLIKRVERDNHFLDAVTPVVEQFLSDLGEVKTKLLAMAGGVRKGEIPF